MTKLGNTIYPTGKVRNMDIEYGFNKQHDPGPFLASWIRIQQSFFNDIRKVKIKIEKRDMFTRI